MYSLLRYITSGLLLILFFHCARAQSDLDACNITWSRQSRHAGESMPCGGGDIGLNVWMENGELLCYISRSGAFDENNIQLKQGRLRIKLSPNPFTPGAQFRQTLHLQQGYIEITGRKGAQETNIRVWVEVQRPLVHIDVNSRQPVKATARYENWRRKDRVLRAGEQFASSGYRGGPVPVIVYHDSVGFDDNKVLFYHRNRHDKLLFDFTVQQQGLNPVKDQLWNPQQGLTFGGILWGNDMTPAGMRKGKYVNTAYTAWELQSVRPSRQQHVRVLLHTDQTPAYGEWYKGLQQAAAITDSSALRQTQDWWQAYWDRSYIFIGRDKSTAEWQAGRNYQLFRYMLGCNAYGSYPTKFNGGLFTYDPVFVRDSYPFTPDHRNWGGGTFTAQNQRLVYWPMLKSGDFDMMRPQFDFYLHALQNATARTRFYWQHDGACFTEQMENFGLPAASEYGWNRPAGFDAGVEYNNWLEYEWDTVLEFCLMILDWERFSGQDVSAYMPLIESCLTFFDEHYQYLAKQRGEAPLDSNGRLVLYPGSAGETYKLAYNSATTIAGLYTVANRLLALPASYLTPEKRMRLQGLLQRIPPLPFRRMHGYMMLSPAQSWQRINNQETPQLYPVFPYGIYGIGKPGLDTARNTWLHDTDAIARRSAVGWKQDNIFCARLGFAKEAAYYTLEKLKNGPNRFPAFWGPGFDWTPDLNQGGSGMIGLQEMLMQTDGKKIYLFPAWPMAWDVRFKLHAPYGTTVSGRLKGGKLVEFEVEPVERKGDVVVMGRG
ncbi:hypothetical protein F0L74_17910 [Chitinophaga agrisoli]|uniref:DUF5703 domain-containing protein n=1 Tax=Chitinophaga agrisoli TaxID=2607653 RepID=A0A5B2VSC6_9BACT|nr:DUF5703 domain-containing protein [Chitinophaga agrisoli]KAA2241744.1 hypothetical protein F0L74_17910 [Chitinophaga agrisoli]